MSLENLGEIGKSVPVGERVKREVVIRRSWFCAHRSERKNTWKVTSLGDRPVNWRVNSMIIAGGQIEHTVVQLVLGVFLERGGLISNEGSQRISHAFYLLNAVRLHFAKDHHLPVHRAHLFNACQETKKRERRRE
jgi:hypothetical protein